MSDRTKRAEDYTRGDGEIQPLTWGRLKIVQRCLADGEELSDECAGDVAAMVYLMPFEKLRTIKRNGFTVAAEAFAAELPIPTVMKCAEAFGRDLAAMEAGEVKATDEGKPQATSEPNRSTMLPLSPQPCG